MFRFAAEDRRSIGRTLTRAVVLGSFLVVTASLLACNDEKARARCEQSCACKSLGQCAPAGRNRCAPATDEHCRASNACRLFGTCSVKERDCVAASADDCLLSDACLQGGLCKLGDDRCVK